MSVDLPRPRRINAAIPPDLETIVLKAIAREPQSRYATAGGLAEDLRRFLADRPIRARRVSTVEYSALVPTESSLGRFDGIHCRLWDGDRRHFLHIGALAWPAGDAGRNGGPQDTGATVGLETRRGEWPSADVPAAGPADRELARACRCYAVRRFHPAIRSPELAPRPSLHWLCRTSKASGERGRED